MMLIESHCRVRTFPGFFASACGAPFTQAGYAGLRTDFMDVDFDHYMLKNL